MERVSYWIVFRCRLTLDGLKAQCILCQEVIYTGTGITQVTVTGLRGHGRMSTLALAPGKQPGS